MQCKRFSFLVILAMSLLLSAELFAGPSILISEVSYDPLGSDADGEWIELFNASENSIDLLGFQLSDLETPTSSGTFILPSFVLGSGEALILARNPDGFRALDASYAGISPVLDMAVSGNSIGLLNNGGDSVELRNASGELLDMVAWAGFIDGWDLTAAGFSLMRTDLPTDPSSWIAGSSTLLPTPGTTDLQPVPEPASLLLISIGTMGLFIGVRRRRK